MTATSLCVSVVPPELEPGRPREPDGDDDDSGSSTGGEREGFMVSAREMVENIHRKAIMYEKK
jgi:hypothetical protein